MRWRLAFLLVPLACKAPGHRTDDVQNESAASPGSVSEPADTLRGPSGQPDGVELLPNYRLGDAADSGFVPLPAYSSPKFHFPSDTGRLDEPEAAAELRSVSLTDCRRKGGPAGAGTIRVTFSGDGSVQAAWPDDSPFIRSAVGACVVHKYKRLRVTPFPSQSITVIVEFVVR